MGERRRRRIASDDYILPPPDSVSVVLKKVLITKPPPATVNFTPQHIINNLDEVSSMLTPLTPPFTTSCHWRHTFVSLVSHYFAAQSRSYRSLTGGLFSTATPRPHLSTSPRIFSSSRPSVYQMVERAMHFTPKVLLSAPRRSAGVPNSSGTHVLYTVSTYSFESHGKTNKLRVLDARSGVTIIIPSRDVARTDGHQRRRQGIAKVGQTRFNS